MELLNSFFLNIIAEIGGGWKWLPTIPEDKGTWVERGFEEFGYQVTPGIKVTLGLIIEITEFIGATI